MPIRHEVAQGDCIESIAQRYGFLPATIWDHPDNAALKRERKDPDVLLPGDVVVVPDRQPKEEPCPPEQKAGFRRKGVPAMLRIRLLDDDGKPRSGAHYTLDVDGHLTDGMTDGDGKIEHPIPPGARSGSLTVEDTDFIPLELGALDPPDTLSGVQGRLRNMGYPCGVTGESDDATRDAIRSFQKENGLEETGEPDDATQDKLRQAHGS